MANQAKRKFTALQVGEVSLVDEPANEKPIIVAKRKEQDMDANTAAQAGQGNAPAAESNTGDSVTKNTEVIQVPAEGPEAATEAVTKMVTTIVDTLKAAGALKEPEAPSAEGEDVEKGKMPPGFLKKMEEDMKKGGMKDDAIKAALSAAKASFGASGIPTKKSYTAEDIETVKNEAAMEALSQLAQSVNKAKAFTPKRQDELLGVVVKLTGLLNDLGMDPEVIKEAFGASGIPATPTVATPKPPMAANPGGVGQPGNSIKKSADGGASDFTEALTKALAPLTEAVGGLNGRVEAIEKARNPSAQPPEGGDGPPVETTKGKSLWSGVL